MDHFVQDQLNQLGCGDLIPLFRDKGHTEDSYKQLTMRKLLELFPEDQDEHIVLKLLWNIKSLNDPANTIGLFPPPSLIVKNEPDTIHDEVQIINVTIRAPSGFTRVEIKEEVVGQPIENLQDSSPTLLNAVKQEHTDVEISGPILSDIRIDTADGGNGVEENPDDASFSTSSNEQLHTSESYEEEESTCTCIRRSSRVRSAAKRYVPQEEPKRKIARINLTDPSHSARLAVLKSILSTLDQAEMTEADFKNQLSNRFALQFLTLEQLDDILHLLETHSTKLSTVLQRLEFHSLSQYELISNFQIQRLSNLPDIFLGHLTKLVFDLKFPKNTDFDLISTILTKCTGLRIFNMRHGLLFSEQFKIFQIPKMDSLLIFRFADDIAFQGTEYLVPPPAVDVDVEEDRDQNRLTGTGSVFVEFIGSKYPKLQNLEVGPFISIGYVSPSKFPNLRVFKAGDSSAMDLCKSNGQTMVFNRMKVLFLQQVLTNQLVEGLPHSFPNLTHVHLMLPRAHILSQAIRIMAGLPIKGLFLMVGYEFESALFTALRGLQFKLITKVDKLKLAKVKRYKYWKEFLKELNIEVPQELCSDEDKSVDKQNAASQWITLSSFQQLETFYVRHIHKSVHIHIGNVHWNNPDVKVSKEEWSSSRPFFPCRILKDLARLKKIERIILPGFQVKPHALEEFKQKKRFDIEFFHRKHESLRQLLRPDNLDWFTEDLLVRCCSNISEIKQETD